MVVVSCLVGDILAMWTHFAFCGMKRSRITYRKPSIRQATCASLWSKPFTHTVPHVPL